MTNKEKLQGITGPIKSGGRNIMLWAIKVKRENQTFYLRRPHDNSFTSAPNPGRYR